jgi:hypothetical protein
VGGGGSTVAPDDAVSTPPALRTPASPGSSGGGQTGSVGGAAQGTVDDVTDKGADVLPVVLPDPGEVVEGVTDQLPDVQSPVPIPPVALPRLP